MQKAVFLDRDGVINDNKRPVNRPEELILYPKAGEAIRLLNEAGYRVFVVTNQGGVGLGYLSEQDLKEIHAKMEEDLKTAGTGVHEIRACTHKPHEGCVCRKPDAGMILELAEKHSIDLHHSYMVGDRITDIQAGEKAGTQTIFIGDEDVEADFITDSLYEAVQWILERDEHGCTIE
ncbi:D-glycero-alpha-D-manno-heptose-1,7-bisphosphate 7-phosphatase [Pseudalkalibacillus sp. Hm43]|uniref:D-glycero-alpha-D-manno-heptose-1,7-bisphosphate 7-phosphatase n=1 Tax=Pseudalkalibacillus sp. Hm43 TaxID=3450742 RepID=UPI003F432884